MDNGDGTNSFTNGTATRIIDTNATSNLYDNSTLRIPAANVRQAIDELSPAININNAADGDQSIATNYQILPLTNLTAGATRVYFYNIELYDLELTHQGYLYLNN